MKLSLACNFEPDLLDAVKEFPVYELFGKMTSDIIGGGRPSRAFAPVGRRKIEATVRQVHAAGIEFNYLLNAACLGNIEFTTAGQREIRRLLDWLAEIKVDSITLNNSMLLRTIKRSYPFKVRIGIFAEVNSPQRACMWEQDGADSICLEDITCNRDFELLAAIRDAVKCDLQLLVNNVCLYSCHMAHTHMDMAAHASQVGHGRKGYYLDYCTFRCMADRLREPVNFIRSTWIRPEDLVHYEKLGYTNFKIADRSSPTELLRLRVNAYAERQYRGNLVDLIFSARKQQPSCRGFLSKLVRALDPCGINPMKLAKLKRFSDKHARMAPLSADQPVMIRNEDLDGFLDAFLKESCRGKNCEKCRYCHRVAEKHVVIAPDYQAEYVKMTGELTADVETGSFWRWGE